MSLGVYVCGSCVQHLYWMLVFRASVNFWLKNKSTCNLFCNYNLYFGILVLVCLVSYLLSSENLNLDHYCYPTVTQHFISMHNCFHSKIWMNQFYWNNGAKMPVRHKVPLISAGNKISLNVKYMSQFVSPAWGPHEPVFSLLKKYWPLGTSLVTQWLGIHLPTQGTWVRSLAQEDPTCHRATKPMCHNYWSPHT